MGKINFEMPKKGSHNPKNLLNFLIGSYSCKIIQLPVDHPSESLAYQTLQ